MFDLVERLKQYFNVVLDTDEFTFAVDPTGFYMFYLGDYDEQVEASALQVVEALSLRKEQCVLAFLSDHSDHNYDSFSFEVSSLKYFSFVVKVEELESFVRKFAGKRDFIFSQKMIDSIVDCFCDVPEEISSIEQQLMDLGVSKEVAHTLFLESPNDAQEVFDLGCPDYLVDEAFDLILEWYKSKNPKETVDDSAFVYMEDAAKKFAWISVTLGLIGCAFLALSAFVSYASVGVLIFGWMGGIFGNRSRKIISNVLGQVGEVLGYALVLIAVVPFAYKCIGKLVVFISSLEFDFSLEEFFNALHF